jgi:hypothetical protein
MMLKSILLAAALLSPVQEQVPPGVGPEDSDIAVKVTVNGERVDFGDTAPIMRGSRILVPMRGVFEKLGATLQWDQANRVVTARRGDDRIILPVNAPQATINMRTVDLDQPAIVARGRTMVPLRFVGEALGARVDWLPAERTVAINTAG